MSPYALPAEIWAAGLIFLRVGAVVMLLPGIGDAAVSPRIRLSFALALALCLVPVAGPTLPAMPETVGAMTGHAIKEVLIGLMIGGLVRLLMAALAVAGEAVAIQSTLAFAQTANPSQAMPGTSTAAFLAVLGVALVFATNLHHLFLGAIANSYALFAPTRPVMVGDAAALTVRTVGGVFALGVQLAAPVLVLSIVVNVSAGLVGRVMPQFQIFFVVAPLSVLLGLSVFALSLGLVGLIWVQRYEAFLQIFN